MQLIFQDPFSSLNPRLTIEEIIEEWNQTDNRFMFVVDDNFFGVGPDDAQWAKQPPGLRPSPARDVP